MGKNIMLGLLYGLQDNSAAVLKQLSMTSEGMQGVLGGISAVGGSGSAGIGGLNINNTVNVIGARSQAEGRLAGDAAAEAFADSLQRRQLVTTARMV
jgi:hypothetical protein